MEQLKLTQLLLDDYSALFDGYFTSFDKIGRGEKLKHTDGKYKPYAAYFIYSPSEPEVYMFFRGIPIKMKVTKVQHENGWHSFLNIYLDMKITIKHLNI